VSPSPGSPPLRIRQAPFAIRIVRRQAGDAAIVYRRGLDQRHRDRLRRVASLGPLSLSAGMPLLRGAARSASHGAVARLTPGPFIPLDADWGARVACYALVAEGLRDAERLTRAADHLRNADAAEAAWWLGLMTASPEAATRATRALRILVEAVV
jgi:hypothetical protein